MRLGNRKAEEIQEMNFEVMRVDSTSGLQWGSHILLGPFCGNLSLSLVFLSLDHLPQLVSPVLPKLCWEAEQSHHRSRRMLTEGAHPQWKMQTMSQKCRKGDFVLGLGGWKWQLLLRLQCGCHSKCYPWREGECWPVSPCPVSKGSNSRAIGHSVSLWAISKM
jgi:hypothetical protein